LPRSFRKVWRIRQLLTLQGHRAVLQAQRELRTGGRRDSGLPISVRGAIGRWFAKNTSRDSDMSADSWLVLLLAFVLAVLILFAVSVTRHNGSS
jgi:hypothetical protein